MRWSTGPKALLAVICLGDFAAGQSICNAHFPIRASGAACSSGNSVGHIRRPDGLMVCCIASPQSARINMPNLPAGSDRYAAGLALGLAGAAIVIDLINLFGPSMASAPPEDRHRENLEGERADAHRQAERWHEAAMREVKKGDMRSAEGFLYKAMQLAENATDYDLRNRYQREYFTVQATKAMMEGLALQAEGKIAEAVKQFDEAAFKAQGSGRKDLSNRILAYRRNLNAQLPKGSPAKKAKIGETSNCLEVNGKMVCE